MNCKDFKENISSYIDNELNEISNKEFELHFLNCSNCRREYEYMVDIVKNIRNQEQVELPDNYRFELNRKLKEAVKEDKKINWKVISSIAAGFIVMIISFSMLTDNFKFMNYKSEITSQDMAPKASNIEKHEENMALDTNQNIVMTSRKEDISNDVLIDESKEKVTSFFESGSIEEVELEDSITEFGAMASRSSVGNGRKSIKEAYLYIEIDELELVSQDIHKYIEENGGYIESFKAESGEVREDISGKNYLIKIRIPANKFEETLEFLKGFGKLIDEESMLSDVTDQYYKMESNLRILNEQQVLLREILDKAESVSDILLVEDEIEKVQKEINAELGAIEKIEKSITLPTINAKFNKVNKDND